MGSRYDRFHTVTSSLLCKKATKLVPNDVVKGSATSTTATATRWIVFAVVMPSCIFARRRNSLVAVLCSET